MKKFILISLFIIVPLLILGLDNNNLETEKLINNLINRMSLKEKIDLLYGEGFYIKENKRLKIPSLKMSDGPAGVRWGRATAFPAPIAFAATWDIDLVEKIGQIMAIELKAYGRNMFLAPCINIHRIPVGSRNFESYGEDPFLTGKIASSFIKGVQKENVIACVKHYAANNQEWNRTKLDVIVDERTLREIYLYAFKMAVKEGGAWSVMAAYNKVNGDYCSENKHLLLDILKGEWGFKGFVVSDWGATHSTIKAANSGLDIEMPFGKHFNDKLYKAVKKGKLKLEIINDKVRRILRAMINTGFFNKRYREKPQSEIKKIITKHKKFSRYVGEESIVLLKNSRHILPLKINEIKSIAVIGPNAKHSRTGGGGSAKVKPFYSVSPLKGVRYFVKNKVKIYYAPGINAKGDIFPINEKYLKCKKTNGLYAEYFKNSNLSGNPGLVRIDKELYFDWSYDLPEPELGVGNDGEEFSIRWTGKLLPPISGGYKLNFLCDGGVRVFINDELVLKDWNNPRYNKNISIKSVKYDFKKNNHYKIRIEYCASRYISEFKFGWEIPGKNPIEEARRIAKKSDIVLLFVGLSSHFETENMDRESMEISNQDLLIKEILKVNKNVVVILTNGSPIILSDWVDEVPAILETWYLGQEQGNAIASVLFGKVNPSGKLPFSWYEKREDCPGFRGYRDSSLKAVFHEGIFVGYRYLEKNKIKPLFPFGYGLSYTKFQYGNLQIRNRNKSLIITFKIKNIGNISGKEITQVYVSFPNVNKNRPIKELKGFKKINLLPDEEKQIQIIIPYRYLKYYSRKSLKWIMEKGMYTINLGSSSENFILKKKINIR